MKLRQAIDRHDLAANRLADKGQGATFETGAEKAYFLALDAIQALAWYSERVKRR